MSNRLLSRYFIGDAVILTACILSDLEADCPLPNNVGIKHIASFGEVCIVMLNLPQRMRIPAGDGAIAAPPPPPYPAIVSLNHYMVNVLVFGALCRKGTSTSTGHVARPCAGINEGEDDER
ncbi:hypothetical protein HBI91_230230 [Parastagonospora nodorum]|nr:hypothetical protein HBI91_230230 [Parastagonospora nodorum]